MNPIVKFLTENTGYTFDEGVALLALYSQNRMVVDQVRRQRNPRLLDAELRKLAHDPAMHRIHPSILAREERFGRPHVEEPVKLSEIEQKLPENEQPAEDPQAKRTRLEDMPTDEARMLWQRNNDRWHEKLALFEKMKLLPEGEELAEVRARLVEVSREHRECWKRIDAICANPSGTTPAPEPSTDYNVSTYRAYITKQLKKAHLSDECLVELQRRVDALIAHGETLKPETRKKLTALGITLK